MSNDAFRLALREVFENLMNEAAPQHPLRTTNCPSIPRFADTAPSDWSDDERTHFLDCKYCQNMLASARSPIRSVSVNIVLAARFTWNRIQKALEITVDDVLDLIAPDSPFGEGFKMADPQFTSTLMGADREEVRARATTEQGEQLGIVSNPEGRIKAYFKGQNPPHLIFAPEAVGEPARELSWDKERGGWRADLGEPDKLNGVLQVELDGDE